jgi:hypothetical protein
MVRILGPDGRPVPPEPKPLHGDATSAGDIQPMPRDVIDRLSGMVGKKFSAFGCVFILGAASPFGIACGFVEETKKAQQLRKKKERRGD